jgi:hypothetical protein
MGLKEYVDEDTEKVLSSLVDGYGSSKIVVVFL